MDNTDPKTFRDLIAPAMGIGEVVGVSECVTIRTCRSVAVHDSYLNPTSRTLSSVHD